MTRTLAAWKGHNVGIHEAWCDSLSSVCVVFEHTSGDFGPIGFRVVFPPHAVEGDPESIGRDVAIRVIEPLGTLTDRLRRDSLGIAWVIGPGTALPAPPTWRHASAG